MCSCNVYVCFMCSIWGLSCVERGCAVLLSSAILKTSANCPTSQSLCLKYSCMKLHENIHFPLVLFVCVHVRYSLFRTVRNLLQVPSLTPLLSSLSSTHNISPFLRRLLSALINAHFNQFGSHGNNAAMETIMSLLDAIPLEEKVVTSLIRYY